MNQKKSVDIIIPIYNAYEDLLLCVDSIYRYTNLKRNRLILINDNSTDGRIASYLEKQIKENVIVIHNETNKGFSNNINIGMSQSESNDVILLNSDTIVTECWVEKMSECAYSDRSIGTVTPTSNNATLCSVPVFCDENILPDGMTIEQAGAIVERCSLKKYPRITVAHGFCMYVKREVINCIGNFDAETFKRGYGEENDFCNRAEQAGFHHVMCDNTYIFHSGTKSFASKEKEAYIKAHEQILRDRYPVQMRNNDLHCLNNPNFFVGDNIGLYFDLYNGKKNILYLVQSDFRKDTADYIGGTQLHVHDLTENLKESYNVFVAARNGEVLNLTVYFEGKERKFEFYIGKRETFYEFNNKMFETLWRNILSAFRIELIHIHHVITTSFDIFYVADEYNIPVIFTAHDFYFICPSIKMVNENDKICIGKDCEEECCNCLNDTLGITDRINYIKLWREHCSEVLDICKWVITPDQSVADVLQMYYPQLKRKLKIIPHGYDKIEIVDHEVNCTNEVICNYEKILSEGFTYKAIGWAYLNGTESSLDNIYLQIKNQSGETGLIPTAKTRRPDVIEDITMGEVGYECVIPKVYLDGGELELTIVIEHETKYYYATEKFITPKLRKVKEKKLNVAFVGGLNKHKGGDIAAEIIESIEEVNWHVLGGVGVKSLLNLERKNLIKTGYYMPEDLPMLLKEHEIDLIGILSISPETYSYTLTEAILNNIPVIVTDIGALGRRVKEMKCGWTVSIDCIADEFTEIVNAIISDRKQYNEFKKNISKLQLSSTAEMTKKYVTLYNESWYSDIKYEIADFELIYNGYQYKDRKIKDGQVYKQNPKDIQTELDIIQSSLSYHVIKKIWKMKIPGKCLIKKLISKWNRN